MKSQSVISEQDYQDNFDEFPAFQYKKNKFQASENRAQIDENYNPCDETMGYIQIVDEYENVDKFKRVPRPSENNQARERRVNLPNFYVKSNPFQKTDFNSTQASPTTQTYKQQTKGGEPNGYYENSNMNGNKMNGQHNDVQTNVVQTNVVQTNVVQTNVVQTNVVQTNVASTDGQPTKNGKDIPSQQNIKNYNNAQQESRYEDSINEDCVDNEIIYQIADQIPELLDRSEMRDLCLTPSIVDGLKQQTQQQKEKKSEFSKKNSITDKQRVDEDEEEDELDKVDAKSQNIDQLKLDVQQRLLEQQQKAQREKEEREQMMLMEGYESDPPLPPEDQNVIYTLIKKEFDFHKKKISKQMIFDLVRDYKFIQAKDECRAPSSHKEGGKECSDKKIKECLRKIGKEILNQVGRKIISGNFNLATISFPIKAMIPKSALEKALYSTCLFPLYINKAVQTTNLVERFKFLICATLGNFYINCGFLKPLNPIIGETCQGFYPDGTRLYAEQISHHPPVSYFTVYGPDKSYLMYGNYNYESNAGLNSLTLKNKGTRHIKFRDGQQIDYNFAKEAYSGSFMGTMKVESKGSITFKDAANNITAEVVIDSVKKRATDFLSGTIKLKDQVVSKCYGSYLGFIEFDDIRYWDYRYVLPYEPIIMKCNLGSDQSKRLDKIHLIKGDVTNAQKYKEQLEELQRADAKLRKKHAEQVKKDEKKKKK